MGKARDRKDAAVKEAHEKSLAAKVATAAANPAVKDAVAAAVSTQTPTPAPAPIPAFGKMPPLPKMSKAKAKVKQPCACGCDTPTTNLWAPGHDARARGWALRIERGICKMEDVPEIERKGAQTMLDFRAGKAGKPIRLVKKVEKAAVESADEAVNQ